MSITLFISYLGNNSAAFSKNNNENNSSCKAPTNGGEALSFSTILLIAGYYTVIGWWKKRSRPAAPVAFIINRRRFERCFLTSFFIAVSFLPYSTNAQLSSDIKLTKDGNSCYSTYGKRSIEKKLDDLSARLNALNK